MISQRRRIELAIEFLIEALDQRDGDPDLEPDPFEEEHNAEADLTWTTENVPPFYIMAERARCRAKSR